MNSNLKNTIFAISSIVIILPAIFLISDYIHFQEPLSRIVLYPDDPKCDAECVKHMNESYKCIEINQDEYVCRQSRGHPVGDYTVRSISAGPISYGEIISFPEGNFDSVLFNIAGVRITDRDSKTIEIDFAESEESPSVIYSAKLKPNDSFLSCINPWKGTHLVYYTDLFEYQNKTYAEFWGLHPYTPPELFPCDLPKLWEQSLRHDYDILIPEYEEFGFAAEDEYASESRPDEIDSRKINPEKEIPIFFEVMLMEQDVDWVMPQREWNNPDFEIEPPARICSEIIYPNGTNVFLSTIFQDPYTLSDMVFHNTLPEDCVKVLPVTEYGKK